MAYHALSLIPTFSNHNMFSDRFAQIDNLFSRMTGASPIVDTPAYNLLQKNKDCYELTVSVPGYTQEELDISVLNNQLTISGKLVAENISDTEEKDNIKWLHQGIRKNEFSLSFNLTHRITIQHANLDKGLLILRFNYNIPEQEKPQKITIGVQPDSSCTLEHNVT